MVTAEEIRARILAADEKRIALRTERATSVADLHQQVADKRAELAALSEALGDATRAALEVMSVDELAEFSDLPRSELGDTAAGRARTGRKKSTVRRTRKPTEKTAPIPDVASTTTSTSTTPDA